MAIASSDGQRSRPCGVFYHSGCRAFKLKQVSEMVGAMVGDETVLDIPYLDI